MIKSARGAITALNTKESILNATRKMLSSVIGTNNIPLNNITSVTFSATRDLTAAYPAVAARELGLVDAALFCVGEMFVEGSLKRCIRCIVNFETDSEQSAVSHVYLGRATILRPDYHLNNDTFRIAVDGTSHSGKSTAAKQAAKSLNLIHFDTGATYRACALYALTQGVDVCDESDVCRLLESINIDIVHENGEQRTILNGVDVTTRIRDDDVTECVKITSNYTPLRRKMLKFQRRFTEGKRVIVDGRDIGTVVFPNTELKVYMDASLVIRAKRRCAELALQGVQTDINDEMRKLAARDAEDMSVIKRGKSALTIAPDAVYIDTSALSAEAVTETLIELIEEKMDDVY